MPTVIDLFCGAGGFSEGFRQAGFDSIVASDVDPWAGATFEHNHARYGTKFVLGDLCDPAVQEELLSCASGREIDAIIGGPPCQAFSQVRNHHRLIDDPRNSLYREFVAILRRVRPRTFIMENVPGLANLGGGKIRDQILEDLTLDGEYRVASRVIDAADHGVPQTRLRVIFVGVRADLNFDPRFPSPPNVARLIYLERAQLRAGYQLTSAPSLLAKTAREKLLDPENTEYVSVFQAIGDLLHIRPSGKKLRGPTDDTLSYAVAPKSAYQRARRKGSRELFNIDCPYIREDTVSRLLAVPQGGNFRDIPDELAKRYLNGTKWGPELGRDTLSRKYFFAYRKLHPKYFSWTLNTKADCVYHYSRPRALTVREFARLHSFDDTYRFIAGDLHSRYRQVGNAVPPLLARAIAKVIRGILKAADQAAVKDERATAA
jgi:DNA (cytosine-5)-methyltransferase 1